MRPWIEPTDIENPEHLLPLVGGNPIAARLLLRRGFADLEMAHAFLDPGYYRQSPAREMPGIERAVDRLLRAISQAEHVLVWGDFDVDGQTATALLVETIRGLGGVVSSHIPVRAVESHGINRDVLQKLLARANPPVKLLLTCDTGISAFEALDYAQEIGLEVIISDHHELPMAESTGEAAEDLGECQLPSALAIITPRLLPEDHPLAGLPGVGVAYKLSEALYQASGYPEEVDKLLDLVALGIVADVAQQTGDTRCLLQLGLKQLRNTQRAGLLALYERAEINPNFVNEEQVGFALAPRLNALGRLKDANPAVELLTTSNMAVARMIALEIEGLNAQRQLLTSQVLNAAISQIKNNLELTRQPVLILSHPAWEPGVIGIVASRLVEMYGKPVVMIANPPGQPARASARSVEGFDITAAIRRSGSLLLGYGGHAMAAGFSIESENIPLFTSEFLRNNAAAQRPDLLQPIGLPVDEILEWGEIDFAMIEALERLSPFGAGNPAPIFVSKDLKCREKTRFGRQGEHLQFIIEDSKGISRRVLWWGGGEFQDASLPTCELMDLAYTLSTSSFQGKKELTITFIDARQSRLPEELQADKKRIHIRDYRNAEEAVLKLRAFAADYPVDNLQIWAEGEHQYRLAAQLEIPHANGLSVLLRRRNQLTRSETLILWTAPCGIQEYQSVLQLVQPKELIVFSIEPPEDDIQVFLRRLAGLIKGLQRKQKSAEMIELASALAQRPKTVQFGIKWLEANSQIALIPDAWDRGIIQPYSTIIHNNPHDHQAKNNLLKQIQDLLEETRSFRKYFNRSTAIPT